MPRKQDVVLFVTKYISYIINIVLCAAVAIGLYFWIMTLIESAK